MTYFPDTPEGNDRWDFFREVVAFHPIKHTLARQDWNLSGGVGTNFAIALFTFLYVDIIDCTATLYSMARFCGKVRKSDGDFPRSTLAYCTDALCISIGSLFGCSPVTAFIESGAGIAEGGRTGLTAITAGFCFLASLFLAPIFASIPPWATGCTLILVRITSSLAIIYSQLADYFSKGRLPYDSPSHKGQLVIYWRCHTIIRHHDLHSVQLQRRIRSDRVSHSSLAISHQT